MTQHDTAGEHVGQTLLAKVVSTVAKMRGPAIVQKVAEYRSRHPHLSRDELARLIVWQKAFYSGVSGAATSLGGLVTMPITLPASVVSSLAFQAEIVLTVAHIYGHPLDHEDRQFDLLAVLMGNRVHEVAKRLGIAAGTRLTRQVVDKVFTREVMLVIWKVVGREILTKNGQKSLFSLMKAVPLVAAPIGFTFDYVAARGVGKAARAYYGGDDVAEPQTTPP